ncbi:MAG: shikimate dehydrogenase [Alphaproteobacteria bacterium]|nr:shikimate dehydrogenase [Alphaproteobacteria bacterium]
MKTLLAGVVGWPVAHSLSPRLHGYWLAAHNIAGSYVKLPVARQDFAYVVLALQRAGFAGVNVTIPHKEAAFALAGQIDDAARATQAANLLVFQEDGTILARNTDVFGLRSSLENELGITTLKGRHVVIAGAGGAARAAVVALCALEAQRITVLNRSQGRAEALVRTLASSFQVQLATGNFADWPDLAADVALLVNCTSIGLGHEPQFMLDLKLLPATARVCDVVYQRSGTALVRDARQLGLPAIDGLGMLMYQAVPSFAAFFGITPEVSPALRRYLEVDLA